MGRRYEVRVDSSRGFTRSERHYIIVDGTTNLAADDVTFTNRKLAAKWAAHLNRETKSTRVDNGRQPGYTGSVRDSESEVSN